MRDLSILIPARSEEWLRKTVEDVLANKRANTEIIVVADGELPLEPLLQHPDLSVILLPASIGQRAATNLAARVSTGRYLMKLDAHCSVAEGFDQVLIDTAAELDWKTVQIPAQKNLHVYDRICKTCGKRIYQGPKDAKCPCGSDCDIEVVWKPRRGTTTTSWRLDENLKFQYGDGSKQKGDICDVLSSLGACFFMTREWWNHIEGLDEAHGSWGQFGAEIALKTWLGGGRHVVNKRTWFAHFFRVGGIGFPYPITGSEQEKARKYSRDLWVNNKWPKQVKPLSWVIDKFAPLPGWSNKPVTKGIVYYTDGRLDPHIADGCWRSLEKSGLPLVAVLLEGRAFNPSANAKKSNPFVDHPLIGHKCPYCSHVGFNDYVYVGHEEHCGQCGRDARWQPAERGYLTMFRQILAGLEALDTRYAFLCEHDVLYHPSHFDFTPPNDDEYFYNLNVWKVDAATGRAITYETKQTSGLCANRELLIKHYRERIRRVEIEGHSNKMGFEPGSHNRPERIDDVKSDVYRSEFPNIDIRHTKNLTPSRWSPEQFRDKRNCKGWTESTTIPGWGDTAGFNNWLT